ALCGALFPKRRATQRVSRAPGNLTRVPGVGEPCWRNEERVQRSLLRIERVGRACQCRGCAGRSCPRAARRASAVPRLRERAQAFLGATPLRLGVVLAVGLALGAPLGPVMAQASPAAPSATRPPAPRAATCSTSARRRGTAMRVGMPAFSLEGIKIGMVESINRRSDGRVNAVTITTGSALGLGAKSVAIPRGKFTVLGGS